MTFIWEVSLRKVRSEANGGSLVGAKCGKKARKQSDGNNRYAVKKGLRHKKARKEGRHD